MIDLADIQTKIATFIGSELVKAGTELQPDTDLVGMVDSTAMVEMIVWIETEFGFDVELDDMTPETFGSIRRIAEYIAARAPSTA